MAQFTAYRNRNPASAERFPLLVDVQSELLDDLATRVVIPLAATTARKEVRMDTLTPPCRIGGKDYLLMTPQMAGVSRRELGDPAGSLAHRRDAILAAIDLLVTGI